MNQDEARTGKESTIRFDNQQNVGSQIGSQTIHGHLFGGPVYIYNEHGLDPQSNFPSNIKTAQQNIASEKFKESVETNDEESKGLMDVPEQRAAYMQSLQFEGSQARHVSIRTAHFKTCNWILNHASFVTWLADSNDTNDRAFLWIKGKPAAGKSTIMKFAFDATKEMKPEAHVVAFFFNARGTELEKSTVGMYMSLLRQLLILNPKLESVFDKLPTLEQESRPAQLNVHQLSDLLAEVLVQSTGRCLIFFIDALDECEEEQIREMVSDLQSVSNKVEMLDVRIRICLSSRHYPHITIDGSVSLILDEQDDHHRDIEQFLQSQLMIGGSKRATEIRQKVLDRSGGIFLWVVLTVRILNQEYDRGRMHSLQKRLDSIPKDLDALFDEMLGRDGEPQAEMILCLQWVLYASEPLLTEELYFAILSGTEPEEISIWDSEEVRLEDMERFIIGCSKGFVEATSTTKRKRIQFIHESVRNYFLLGPGLQRQCFGSPTTFLGRSHDRLAKCCQNYYDRALDLMEITSQMSVVVDTCISQFEAYLRKARALPFLSYAHKNLLKHAELANSSGISQDSILKWFPVARWWNVNSASILDSESPYISTEEISLLFIVSCEGLNSLVGLILRHFENYPVTEHKGHPTIDAICSYSALSTLLTPRIDGTQSCPQDEQSLKMYSKDFFSFAQIKSGFKQYKEGFLSRISRKGANSVLRSLLTSLYAQTCLEPRKFELALETAALHGQVQTIEILLDYGVDVNVGGTAYTALYAASVNGHIEAVRVLLARGADVDAQCGTYGTALGGAAMYGKTEVFRLLLENGADIEAPYGHESSILTASVIFGSADGIRLLLEHGANVNALDEYEMTVLQIASIQNRPNVVKMLIGYGALIDALPGPFGTALQASATFGYVEPTRVLLEHGADIDALDRDGNTALQIAREKGFNEIVEMLLAHGAK